MPRKRSRTGRKTTPPTSPLPDRRRDPAEAIRQMVRRQDPVVRDDDVVILRTGGGLRNAGQVIYQVHMGARGPLPDQFTVFEGAAVKGDEVARAHKVSLFYLDSPHDAPFLVRNYRDS